MSSGSPDSTGAVSSTASLHKRESDIEDASEIVDNEDDDYTSSSGSSTDHDDEGKTQEQPQITHGPGRPQTKFQTNDQLKSRLAEFLPRLQRSNQELEALEDPQSRNIEAQEGDDQYVEMNLALGILSERQPDADIVRTQEEMIGAESNADEGSADLRGATVSLRQAAANKTKIQEL